MKRDGSSREDASARLNAQLPIAEKVPYADVVLDNSGSPQDLEHQVDIVIEAGEVRAEPTTVVDWSEGAPEVLRHGAGDPSRFE